MKGKTKKKKLIKGLVIAASFVLTIMLSVGATLAWFYDSDWASNSVTMAGSVGIQMRDSDKKPTRGAGALHFKINGTRAYPGQAMDIEASVFNDGGSSVVNKYNAANSKDFNEQWEYENGLGKTENFGDTYIEGSGAGSPCYIRAQFAVLTNIGDTGDASSVDNQFNAEAIYKSLGKLVNVNYGTPAPAYKWIYHRIEKQGTDVKSIKVETNTTTGATTASEQQLVNFEGTPIDLADAKYSLDGVEFDLTNLGYYYLCYSSDSKTLYPVTVGSTAAFLFNSTFVIHWALTNASADKDIYIGVSFEAIQTYVPKMNMSGQNFSIWGESKDNELDNNSTTADVHEHYYYADSVQVMFKTSSFGKIGFDMDKSASGLEYIVGETASVPAGYTLITGPKTTLSA